MHKRLNATGEALEYIQDLEKHNFVKAYETTSGNELFFILCNIKYGIFVTVSTYKERSTIDSGDMYGEVLVPDGDPKKYKRWKAFWLSGGSHSALEGTMTDAFSFDIRSHYPPDIIQRLNKDELVLTSPWLETSKHLLWFVTSAETAKAERKGWGERSDLYDRLINEKIQKFPDDIKKILTVSIALS